MFTLKKQFILSLALSIIIVSALIYNFSRNYSANEQRNYISPVPAVAEEIDNQENLIKALESAKSEEERKKILEDNRDMIKPDFSIAILWKASELIDPKTFSTEKSKKLIQIAIQASEFIGDKISLAKALFQNSYLEAVDQRDPNLPSLQKALKLFLEAGDRKGEACCYVREAGRLHYISGKTGEAVTLLDKAISIFKEIDDELRTGDCYLAKGDMYRATGDKDKALENFKQAIAIYEKEGDIMSLLNCYQSMAFTYQFCGFLEEAGNYLEIKRKLIDEIKADKIKELSRKEEGYNFRDAKFEGKDKLMINYYTDFASLHSMMGKYEQSIKSYKEAIELGKKLDKRTFSEMFSYWQLGRLYLILGQKDIALKYYLEAMSKNKEDMPVYQVVMNYMMLGNFYLKEMKQPDEAMKYLQLGLEELKKIGMNVFKDQYTALCIQNMGQVYLEKGDYDKAIEKMEESLKIFEETCKNYGSQGDYYLVWNYDLLGKVYQKKGDQDKALMYMNKAVEFAEKRPAFAIKPGAYNYLGNFYYDTEEFSKALEAYKESLKAAEKISSPSLLWEVYFSLGKTYEKLGNLQEAYNAYDNSIKIIENMRQEFKVEDLKRDFMQDKIKVYEHMIDLLIKMKKDTDAFDYNERCRSRAFLDILANQKVDIHHGINPQLAAKEENLITRIQYLSSDIRQEKEKPLVAQKSAFIKESDENLKNLKLDYEQVLEQIKMECPEYLSFTSIHPLTIKDLQSLLDKDTVIIEYFLGENKNYCWIIGNNSFNTVIIDCPGKNIESLVREYRDCACDNMTAKKIKSDKWRDMAKKLYSILFKDTEKYIRKKSRILICPHKVLHYLPFQVLTDDKGTMLVEKYDITYLPSASVLKYCQDKNTLKKDRLLAFELGNFKVGELSSLPGTEEEVNSISPYFPQKEVYSGKDMSADILYKKGGEFDVLHLATHGIMDTEAPLFSSLVFADRRLNVYEIFDLNLKAYLVTLSACKTGIGEEANGDELVGLSRAFIYAGTPTICSSLWDVSDRASSELMERFYFHLKDKNKAEALRLAQIELMKKYRHPFFWAPFVLTGDWR